MEGTFIFLFVVKERSFVFLHKEIFLFLHMHKHQPAADMVHQQQHSLQIVIKLCVMEGTFIFLLCSGNCILSILIWKGHLSCFNTNLLQTWSISNDTASRLLSNFVLWKGHLSFCSSTAWLSSVISRLGGNITDGGRNARKMVK